MTISLLLNLFCYLKKMPMCCFKESYVRISFLGGNTTINDNFCRKKVCKHLWSLCVSICDLNNIPKMLHLFILRTVVLFPCHMYLILHLFRLLIYIGLCFVFPWSLMVPRVLIGSLEGIYDISTPLVPLHFL